MIARILLAAIAAGLFAGLLMAAAQQIKTVPLILEAETYENGTAHSHGDGDAHSHEDATATGGESPAAGAENPGTGPFGLSRLAGTLLSSLVTGAGFGLLLAGAALVANIALTARSGLAMGAAGWAAFQLLPALGLPPELPGFPYADLTERQIWWVATALLSSIGLYLVLARREGLAVLAGLVLIAAPHLFGAPRPDDISSSVPAFLASEYVVASLSITLLFWLVLGASYGWLVRRLDASDEAG